MNALKRQDGTISRTKSLNAVGLVLSLIGVILPVVEIYISPEIYSAVIAVFAILNNHFRTTQDRL